MAYPCFLTICARCCACAQAVLAAHNAFRANYGDQPLVWSNDLATDALVSGTGGKEMERSLEWGGGRMHSLGVGE